MLLKRLYCLVSFLILISGACGQPHSFLPEITSFSKLDYLGGGQNWNIKQSKNGLLYVANAEGLLCFDGVRWKKIPLPGRSWLRSIGLHPSGKVFVGGQNEMGYFSADSMGEMTYHNLKSLLSGNDESFDDVWNITILSENVVFRTTKKLFVFRNGSFHVFNGENWRFSGIYNNRLVAQDLGKGLFQYVSGKWMPLFIKGFDPHYHISGMHNWGSDSTIIVTQRNGIFLINEGKASLIKNRYFQQLEKDIISHSIALINNEIAIGTRSNGCYVFDRNLIQKYHFSRLEGLPNNNVVSLYADLAGSLWLGLENGISHIQINGALHHFAPDQIDNGAGYSSIVFHDSLYVGTSNALYVAPIQIAGQQLTLKSPFQKVQGSTGQVWGLHEIHGRLLMAHHDGAFEISGGQSKLIDASTGYWTFLPFQTPTLPDNSILAGNYKGIQIFSPKEQGYQITKTSNFSESSRFVQVFKKNIWIAQPYKGFYEAQLNQEDFLQVAQHQIPELGAQKSKGYLFGIRNQLLAITPNGIMVFNPQSKKFQASNYFNELMPEKNIRYIKEDQFGNIWYVADKSLYYLMMSEDQPTRILISEFTNKMVNGFENIYVFDEHNVIVGTENGFYLLDIQKYLNVGEALVCHLSTVKLYSTEEKLLFNGNYSGEALKQKYIPSIKDGWNALYFEFSCPEFGREKNIQYSFFLEGYDRFWSTWSQKTTKEYTSLPAGTYKFHVKCKDNLGQVSPDTIFAFEILPPWYQHKLMFFLYFLTAIGVIIVIRRYQRKKVKLQLQKLYEEQQRKEYLQQLELERTESEIIRLQNEKLAAEVEFKTEELASKTMHLLQKAAFVHKLKEELIRINKNNGSISNVELNKAIKAITEEEKIDEDWDHFAQHFDKVHTNFLTNLKIKFPHLTSTDLKLCAYLRLNLSSKEIAQLLNITVKGVELSRYRLRKKLALNTEEKILDFLMKI